MAYLFASGSLLGTELVAWGSGDPVDLPSQDRMHPPPISQSQAGGAKSLPVHLTPGRQRKSWQKPQCSKYRVQSLQRPQGSWYNGALGSNTARKPQERAATGQVQLLPAGKPMIRVHAQEHRADGLASPCLPSNWLGPFRPFPPQVSLATLGTRGRPAPQAWGGKAGGIPPIPGCRARYAQELESEDLGMGEPWPRLQVLSCFLLIPVCLGVLTVQPAQSFEAVCAMLLGRMIVGDTSSPLLPPSHRFPASPSPERPGEIQASTRA